MINNLQTLYKTDFRHLSETVIRDLEATEEIQLLRSDIKTQIPGSNWTNIRIEILQEMQQLLDIELQPILVESWKTHQDVVREISAQKQSTTDEISILHLPVHEIRSTHSPSLNITIAETVHPMKTFIGVTLILRDVSLSVQHGEIKEILSGMVKGKGFMQYQNATLIEKEFLDFDITSKIVRNVAGNMIKDSTASIPGLPTQSNTESRPPIDPSPKQSTVIPKNQQHTAQEEKASSPPSNMIQFIIGVSIALLAVYLFWQFK